MSLDIDDVLDGIDKVQPLIALMPTPVATVLGVLTGVVRVLRHLRDSGADVTDEAVRLALEAHVKIVWQELSAAKFGP